MKDKRLAYLDFAKGFAILSIVAFHYCQPYVAGFLSKVIMIGGSGVHLFFLLSGFGLGLGLSTEFEAIAFYKRRFVKILLPYYFVLLVIFAINSIYPVYKNSGLYALLGHLFFYKMFDESIVGSFGYHFWFLSTIIQFYIVFPLIVALKQKTTVVGFVAISVFVSLFYGLLITNFGLTGKRVIGSFFLQYFWEFNIGIVLAQLYKEKGTAFWAQSNRILFLVAMGGISLMAFMAIQGGSVGKVFNDIPASIGYVGLSAFLFSIFKNIFNPLRILLIFIGTISYELYLVHMIVFVLFRKMTIHSSFSLLLSFLVVLPVSILLSSYLNKLFSLIISKIR